MFAHIPQQLLAMNLRMLNAKKLQLKKEKMSPPEEDATEDMPVATDTDSLNLLITILYHLNNIINLHFISSNPSTSQTFLSKPPPKMAIPINTI